MSRTIQDYVYFFFVIQDYLKFWISQVLNPRLTLVVTGLPWSFLFWSEVFSFDRKFFFQKNLAKIFHEVLLVKQVLSLSVSYHVKWYVKSLQTSSSLAIFFFLFFLLSLYIWSSRLLILILYLFNSVVYMTYYFK